MGIALQEHFRIPGLANVSRAWIEPVPRMGDEMLRITTHEDDGRVGITLEGRIAGPWLAELTRVWAETAPRLGTRKLSLDLRNVTYSDAGGRRLLKDIYAQSHAEIVTSTLWTKYLAEEIMNAKPESAEEENGHGIDA